MSYIFKIIKEIFTFLFFILSLGNLVSILSISFWTRCVSSAQWRLWLGATIFYSTSLKHPSLSPSVTRIARLLLFPA